MRGELQGLGSTCRGAQVVEEDVDGVYVVDKVEGVQRWGRGKDLDMTPCLGCDMDLHICS